MGGHHCVGVLIRRRQLEGVRSSLPVDLGMELSPLITFTCLATSPDPDIELDLFLRDGITNSAGTTSGRQA